MDSKRTHYDNLKVSRDAPIEVIRAAYRSLAQRYHPDVHPDKEKAARIMRIVNTSYEVLSDPIKRREHDRWIENVETPITPSPVEPRPAAPPPARFWTPWPAGTRMRRAAPHPNEPEPPPAPPLPVGAIVAVGVCLSVVAVAGTMFIPEINTPRPSETAPTPAPAPQAVVIPTPTPAPATVVVQAKAMEEPPPKIRTFRFERLPVIHYKRPKPREYVATLAPSQPVYTRPALAPNGLPWPAETGYFTGVERLDAGGNSVVTIDNRQTTSDRRVRIFEHSTNRLARDFFLRAGQEFRMDDFKAGEYDVRYEDLTFGGFRESQPFTLTEHEERDPPDADGKIQVWAVSTTFELTLYTVINGNTRSKLISAARFEGKDQ